MKTAAIMSRVSSDEQAKGYSLDAQENELLRYCQNNDIDVGYSFREDHSAKTFNRPKFKEFQNLITTRKLKVDYLIIISWDRFSRNIQEALNMIDWLKKRGVTIIATQQPLDMNIPENLAILSFYLSLPEIDNKRRSMKIKSGIREALKSGRWVRKAIIGYNNARDESNKPIIVPSLKAPLIKLAFTSISSGSIQTEVRKVLLNKGLKLSRSNFSKLLRNPVYMGKIIVPASEEEPTLIVSGIHEPIITEALFFNVQDILNGRVKSRNKPKFHVKRLELPLRGNLLCSKCNNKLTGSASRSKTGKQHFYYHCNHCHQERYKADLVNSSVKSLMKGLEFKSTVSDLYKMILQDVFDVKNVERISTSNDNHKNLAEIMVRIENLQDLYVDRKITGDDYIKMKTRYEAERRKIELSLKQFKDNDNSLQVKLDKCYKVLSQLDKLYEKADNDYKKRLISSIFPDKIIFDGKKSRTPRINEVLRLALMTDKAFAKNKTGQNTEKCTSSRSVERTGIELCFEIVIEPVISIL
jgi:DNA invertase Pin-like site-specific DNA recombinase/transcription elongation factor Elf1